MTLKNLCSTIRSPCRSKSSALNGRISNGSTGGCRMPTHGARRGLASLGRPALLDPCGPTELYGSRSNDWRKVRTSTNGLAADPDEPMKLLRSSKSPKSDAATCLITGKSCAHTSNPEGFWVCRRSAAATRISAASRPTRSASGAWPRFSRPALPFGAVRTEPLTSC